jgi:hypothetical protein
MPWDQILYEGRWEKIMWPKKSILLISVHWTYKLYGYMRDDVYTIPMMVPTPIDMVDFLTFFFFAITHTKPNMVILLLHFVWLYLPCHGNVTYYLSVWYQILIHTYQWYGVSISGLISSNEWNACTYEANRFFFFFTLKKKKNQSQKR